MVHFIKSTQQHIRSNLFGLTMNIVALTLCLFLLGVVFVLYKAVDRMRPSWMENNQAVIYLRPQTSSEEQAKLAQELKGWPEIASMRSLSKDEAWKEIERQLGEWKSVLQGIGDNPLPPSLEVTFKFQENRPEEIQGLLEKIRRFPQVEEIFNGNNWPERLEFLVRPMKLLGIGITGLLAAAVVLIVFHSIRVAVFARRDEVEIYRMLGATPFFTRVPFYLEGLFQGSAGALLAAVALVVFVVASEHALPLPMAAALPGKKPEIFLLMMGLLSCGMILSWLGSWLALKSSLPTENRMVS